MKLTAILEDDENIMMIPLIWLTRKQCKDFIQMGYEVIPIARYQETTANVINVILTYRAYKIIGKYTDDNWWIHNLSIPIWEDWKLTAKYANSVEKSDTTIDQQMFDRLDDDEKIQILKYGWYIDTRIYIKKYFREHPELLKRAKNSLNLNDIHRYFKELYDN